MTLVGKIVMKTTFVKITGTHPRGHELNLIAYRLVNGNLLPSDMLISDCFMNCLTPLCLFCTLCLNAQAIKCDHDVCYKEHV